jgi:hypothetical protein
VAFSAVDKRSNKLLTVMVRERSSSSSSVMFTLGLAPATGRMWASLHACGGSCCASRWTSTTAFG